MMSGQRNGEKSSKITLQMKTKNNKLSVPKKYEFNT